MGVNPGLRVKKAGLIRLYQSAKSGDESNTVTSSAAVITTNDVYAQPPVQTLPTNLGREQVLSAHDQVPHPEAVETESSGDSNTEIASLRASVVLLQRTVSTLSSNLDNLVQRNVPNISIPYQNRNQIETIPDELPGAVAEVWEPRFRPGRIYLQI